jgi:pimeloyl-ACP methyl ester carboxylesterase
MVDRWLFGKEVDAQNRFFLGGIGFGGLLALETALQLQSRAMAPAGVLLIGSARSHTSIRSSYRFMQTLIGRLPAGIGRWRLARAQNKIASDESMSTIHRRLLQDMAQDFDWSLLRWQVRALAGWNRHRSEFESSRIPIYQIHGRGDRFYRIPPVEDATILIHGQHLINLSLSGEVNRWIESILRDNELRYSQRREI